MLLQMPTAEPMSHAQSEKRQAEIARLINVLRGQNRNKLADALGKLTQNLAVVPAKEYTADAIQRAGVEDVYKTVFELKRFLAKHYSDVPLQRGRLRLTLAKLDRSRYVFAFDSSSRASKVAPGESRATAAPFWQALLIAGSDGPSTVDRDIVLIFSNESPQDCRGRREDDRGFNTGSGEVVAAYELAVLLTGIGRKARILRSRDTTAGLLAERDTVLIFIGSQLGMPCLRQLLAESPWRQQQRFAVTMGSKNGKRYGCIEVDGRPRYWCGPPKKGKPELQYAVVSLLHRPDLNQILINLAGISTLGTEQAASSLCHDSTVSDFRTLLTRRGQRGLHLPAQFVLEVEVHGNLPKSAAVREAYIGPDLLHKGGRVIAADAQKKRGNARRVSAL